MRATVVRGALSLAAVLLSVAPAVRASGPGASPPLPPRPRFAFQPIGDDQGLLTKTVISLAQDRDGFVWAATQDGLYRLDGTGATRFDAESGLPGEALQLVTGPDGAVWAVTRKALARPVRGRFVPFPLPAGFEAPARGQILAFDAKGRAVVATGRGVLRLEPDGRGQPRLFRLPPGDADSPVEAVSTGPDGGMFIGAAGRVHLLRDDVVTALPSEGIPAEPIVAVLAGGDGSLWVRTAQRLLRRPPAAPAFREDPADAGPAHDFGGPTLDRFGVPLVPTPSGLLVFVSGRWERIGRDRGARTNSVTATLEGRDGSLILAHGGAGLERWPGRTAFQAWSAAEGLPDDVAWCSARDRQGRLYVGTNGGLGIFEDGRGWRTIGERDGLSGRTVRQLFMAPDGSVWSRSVPGGLTRIDPKTLAATPVEMPGDVGGFTTSPDGGVWLGTRRHLYRAPADGRGPAARVEVAEEIEGRTWFLETVPGGVVWAAGRAGLARFDGRSWRLFGRADGLLEDGVLYLASGSPDEVWLGYRDSPGISHLSLSRGAVSVRHFAKRDGLASDRPFFLGVDRAGRCWAGSDSGVAVVQRDGTVRNLSRSDGLLWDDCSAEGFYAEADGSILIGTSRGLCRYDPQGDPGPEPPPQVLLASITLGSRDATFEGGASVPYRDNRIVARLSAVTFRDASQVRFLSRLRPLEDSWVETSSREVRYAGLRPGSYRLEALARAPTGELGKTPATYAFVVRPAWWQTLGFRLSASALLALLAMGAWRLRVRRLVHVQRHLEGLVESRTQLLNQRNEELHAALGRLSEAQHRIVQLSERSPANFDDLSSWVEEAVGDIARMVGVPRIGVYSVDGEKLATLSGDTPAPDLLDGVRNVREPRPLPGAQAGSCLFPVLGPTGETRGALVVPKPLGALGEVERRLLDSFARHLGTTLDLKGMRERLREAERERRRTARELEERGVDTLRLCPRCGRCFDQRTEACTDDATALDAARVLPLVVAGRYRLERRLGEGAVGTVFAGRDETLGSRVAVKIIRPEHADDVVMKTRLEREARIIGRLRHPGVVGLHDQGELPDGSSFLVMELLEGLDMAQVLERHGPGTPLQVAQMVVQVADALEAAHQAGVVHRDLKPANLFLVPRSPGGALTGASREAAGFQVKVLDFGLAKAAGESVKATRTGFIVGSPSYMSPEQVREEALDGRSDLFSLASVTYELLTGEPAFDGFVVADIFTAVLKSSPQPLGSRLAGAPRALEDAFFAAFEKNRARRPPSVRAWSEAVVPLLRDLPGFRRGWPPDPREPAR